MHNACGTYYIYSIKIASYLKMVPRGVCCCLLLCMLPWSSSLSVTVDLDKVLHTVDDKFISITLDQGLLMKPKWQTLNFKLVELKNIMIDPKKINLTHCPLISPAIYPFIY